MHCCCCKQKKGRKQEGNQLAADWLFRWFVAPNFRRIRPLIFNHSEEVERKPNKMPRTDESGLLELTQQERDSLMSQVIGDNKFAKIAIYVQMNIKIAHQVIKQTAHKMGSSAEVKDRFLAKQTFPRQTYPIGGLAFFKNVFEGRYDEDEMPEFWSARQLARYLFFEMQSRVAWSEAPKDLFYFESTQEAIAAMIVTFDRILPQQFNTWDCVWRDKEFGEFLTEGLGQHYLQSVTKVDGRDVPETALVECSTEYMGKYDTRKPWVRYGGVVYMGNADGSSQLSAKENLVILGIYSCHYKETIYPGGPKWEFVKSQFRSSIITSVTLLDHLGFLHWAIANQFQAAVRESFGPNHPLRRLCKPHYFGTAAINWDSQAMLMPVHEFGHRTFAFTDESWAAYFDDALSVFSYDTHVSVQNVLSRGSGVNRASVPGPSSAQLPSSFLQQLPLHQDGMELWRVMRDYAQDYIALYFKDDASVLADPEIVDFWEHFKNATPEQAVMGADWGLPELSRESLSNLLADFFWWVTGGHEFVGSIVMYITSPRSFPPKLEEGSVESDVQSFAQGLVIIALTGTKMPALINDWNHLFLDENALPIVDKWQSCLKQLAATIDARNEKRDKLFSAMNPKILECSVSI